MNSSGTSRSSSGAIETSIRLGVIFLLIAWCLYIVSPFVGMVAWGAIIAVAIYPFYQGLNNRVGGNKKLSLVLTSVIALAAIILPSYAMFSSLVDGATFLGAALKAGTLSIPSPSETVRAWPLIGEEFYDFWGEASANLSAMITTYHDQLVGFGRKLLSMAAGAGLGILQFIVSILIAIAFLARAEPASLAARRLVQKLAGEQSEQYVNLSIATIRSVANGLLGIALFQALLAGIGMMAVDVPAAGFLAFIVLIVAIVQLPPLLILGPVAVYVFSVQDPAIATLFIIWSMAVSSSDALLKPIFLGRGVDAPVLVVLLGAIGGMLMSGIIGLFVGAIVLTLGYKLFGAWVQGDALPVDAEEAAAPDQDQAT
ncbi:MAG: AI-2E family transporter [Mariprofundaceae bacterium]|nr:AI-2E family transporter [Mariprofundaceae bacterium]